MDCRDYEQHQRRILLWRAKHRRKSAVIRLSYDQYKLKIVRDARLASQEVTQIRLLGIKHDSYPVCPHCGYSMEREYQSFCDRCGQKLAWNQYPQCAHVEVAAHQITHSSA